MYNSEFKKHVPDGNSGGHHYRASTGTQAAPHTQNPIAGRNTLGLPALIFNANGVNFTMVRVDKGSFYRGLSLKALQQEISSGTNWKNNYPLVTLDTYFIGETPVTQELWEAVMQENNSAISYWDKRKGIFNPSRFKGKDLPVDSIDLRHAHDFLQKLNNLTGWTFGIPSNDEWEFAARGGNLSKGYTFPGSDDINEVAWYQGNSYMTTWKWDGFLPHKVKTWQTHPVKAKRSNELGLYDMSGNICELCRQEYNNLGICRGGSFENEAYDCEIANFYCWNQPGNTGIRLALRISDNWRLQIRR